MTSSSSPFAEIPPADWLASPRSAFAIADAYPVSEGHSPVVPRRLIATWWEASRDGRHDLMDLVDEMKALLDRHQPDGYDVGFNAGAAAGQTVEHLHLPAASADPRGGIRLVIPAGAATRGGPTTPRRRPPPPSRRPRTGQVLRIVYVAVSERVGNSAATGSSSGTATKWTCPSSSTCSMRTSDQNRSEPATTTAPGTIRAGSLASRSRDHQRPWSSSLFRSALSSIVGIGSPGRPVEGVGHDSVRRSQHTDHELARVLVDDVVVRRQPGVPEVEARGEQVTGGEQR